MDRDRRPELLTVREVMTLLRKRHAFVRELIATGVLETREVGGQERITTASLDRYVGRTPAPAPDTAALAERMAAIFERAAAELRALSA